MTLPDLASLADLSARGVDVSQSEVAATMLRVASSVVRRAAQSPILSTTSTVDLWVTDSDHYLELPGKPVTAVSAVTVDGAPVSDFRLVYGSLYRRSGFGFAGEPVPVTVTLTHGYAQVPAHVTQLVCDLAIAGMHAAESGVRDPRVVAEKIDDYSVTFAQGADAVASAVELPSQTRQALRREFGGGAALVVSR